MQPPERTTANQQFVWPRSRDHFLPTRPSRGNESWPQVLLTSDPREATELSSLQLAPKYNHIFNHTLTTSTGLSFADDSTVAFMSTSLHIWWRSSVHLTMTLVAQQQQIPEKVERTIVDFSPIFQTLSGVLLLPAAEHELLVWFVTLSAIVVGGRLQHSRGNFELGQKHNNIFRRNEE